MDQFMQTIGEVKDSEAMFEEVQAVIDERKCVYAG
jgi:hypothetical protein